MHILHSEAAISNLCLPLLNSIFNCIPVLNKGSSKWGTVKMSPSAIKKTAYSRKLFWSVEEMLILTNNGIHEKSTQEIEFTIKPCTPY